MDEKELECPKCGYEWTYKGKMTEYCTCPNCRKGVKITENEVEK